MIKRKKKIEQEENKKNIIKEYSLLLEDEYIDSVVKHYINILKIQYDEKTLNQNLLLSMGYLKTLYFALKYELHYCQHKLRDKDISPLETKVYNYYFEECNKFLYIISRLIIFDKQVKYREKRIGFLENHLKEEEIKKLRKKYIKEDVELDYNFDLCLNKDKIN